jgi:hypothetical protein
VPFRSSDFSVCTRVSESSGHGGLSLYRPQAQNSPHHHNQPCSTAKEARDVLEHSSTWMHITDSVVVCFTDHDTEVLLCASTGKVPLFPGRSQRSRQHRPNKVMQLYISLISVLHMRHERHANNITNAQQQPTVPTAHFAARSGSHWSRVGPVSLDSSSLTTITNTDGACIINGN